MSSNKLIKPLTAFLILGGLMLGAYYYQAQQNASNEINLFDPEESKQVDTQASLFDPLAAPNQKYNYTTSSQTNEDIRAKYADCISQARRSFQPEKYDLSQVFCEQDAEDFVTYLEKTKSDSGTEIVTWWRAVALGQDSAYYSVYECLKGRPSNENGYQSLSTCLSTNGSNNYLNNLIYFVGGYIRRNINDNLRYSFMNNQLDYKYLGGKPGTHIFLPYDAEDAYFWYCYLKEEPVYFNKLFNNVYFKPGISNLDNLRCAAGDQLVYMASAKSGPTYCCNEKENIISMSTPSVAGNLTSTCVSAEGGVRGKCFLGWYEPNENYQYCGNGMCETSTPRNENQCNCPEDCPNPNSVFFTSRELTISEDADIVDITITRRSGLGMGTVSYIVSDKSEGSPVSTEDYENLNKGLVRFAVGETSATIQLKIIDDTDKEPSETLRLTLTNPVNSNENPARTEKLVLGEPREIQLTVLDND